MNHAKLDAPLAAAMDESRDPGARVLIVFVDLETDAIATSTGSLARFGLAGDGDRGGVRTTTLSARDVAELSEQPWVARLRLAQRLNLSDEG